MPFVDLLLVVSKKSKKLRLNRERYPKSKLKVLYNSIDTSKFFYLKKPSNKIFSFGTASRLIELKQVDKTIELIYLLKKNGIRTNLFIAGEDFESQAINLVKKKT